MVESSFVPTLISLANVSNVDPVGAAALMMYESGLNPAAYNATVGAVGINQLANVNHGIFAPLTVAQYQALSATAQLQYVFKFWNSLNRKGATFLSGRDLYWLNYKPATFVPGAPDSHVIGPTGGDPSLDHGHKGYVTAGDLQQTIDSVKTRPAWKALLAQGLSAGATGVAAVASAVNWPIVAAVGLLGLGGFAAYQAGWFDEHRGRRLNPIRAEESKVQSLLFKRDEGWTEAKALRWAASHGYRHDKVDSKPNTIRIRQRRPGGRMRTVRFGRGISAVVSFT